MRPVLQETVPSGRGARVAYRRTEPPNSELRTRSERKPSARQPGAFVVVKQLSRVIQMCCGSGAFTRTSYALICNTSWFNSRTSSGMPAHTARTSLMY